MTTAPIRKSLALALLVLAALAAPAGAQWNLLCNGDFESGTTCWTKTQGYFDVQEFPAGSGNHVGLLRGATGYTSTIEQTLSLSPAQYALYFETEGHTACSTTATVLSGGSSYSTTVNSNAGGFTLDFTVPSGASSATLQMSVTCSGLGRYIRLDNGFVVFTAP